MNTVLIDCTVNFVKEKLHGAEAGHDWFHIERVWKLSKKIAETENCNLEVVELSALLHDIADPKFHGGDETLALKISREFLEREKASAEIIEQVLFIIKNISFKNRGEIPETIPVELKIVQDADRLDAIGAIGIGRAFAYGGFMKREMHNPDVSHEIHNTFEEYKSKSGSTINHFYEKLLLLKDKMNTKTGREKAMERHEFMESFLVEFYSEWEGSH